MSFSITVSEIVAQAAFLAKCKAEDRFDEFAEALFTCGILGDLNGIPKAEFFWQRLQCGQGTVELPQVKRSSDLCYALGLELENSDVPKAALVYELFAAMADDFLDIAVTAGQHFGGIQGRQRQSHRVTMRHAKTGNNMKHPLFEYFQGREPRDFVSQRIDQKTQPLQKVLSREFSLQFGQLLSDLQMNFPSDVMAKLLGPVLQRGLNGEPIVLTGAFCPDYSYEETGNPSLPYRYTFHGLGSGVGLVAQQFARTIPRLSAFLQTHNIEHKIVLGIGDFEADSQETLDRVKLNRSEFLDRCKQSLQEFSKRMNSGLPLTLEMCDQDRGNGRLRPFEREAQKRMLQGDFGQMDRVYSDPNALVSQILKECRTFYERWYNRELTDQEVLEKVVFQGGEYAALARMDYEDFGKNVIVVSGDRPMMHAFDQFFMNLPVLSVKRAY